MIGTTVSEQNQRLVTHQRRYSCLEKGYPIEALSVGGTAKKNYWQR